MVSMNSGQSWNRIAAWSPFFIPRLFQGAGQGVDPLIEPVPGDVVFPQVTAIPFGLNRAMPARISPKLFLEVGFSLGHVMMPPNHSARITGQSARVYIV